MNKLNIIYDCDGNPIIVINDIRFKGKRHINWNEVERYVSEFVGNSYEVFETADIIYIGKDFPNEIKGSADTQRLRGANAKAKANAVQELPQLINYAINKRWQENMKSKHIKGASFGWFRFTTRFAIPIYNAYEEVERFNVYRIEMLVRHAVDGKMYLYDFVNIKKETSTPPES